MPDLDKSTLLPHQHINHKAMVWQKEWLDWLSNVHDAFSWLLDFRIFTGVMP